MSFATGYLRQGLLLLLGVAVIAAASLLILRGCEEFAGKTGASIGHGIEGGLREAIKAQFELDPSYHEIRETELDAAMAAIRDRLVSSMETPPPWPLEIIVVSNNELNAFTLPGGLILVHSGLIRRSDNPEELAAVLAHEIGHVAHGDIMKSLGRNLAIGAVLAAGGNVSPAVLNDIIHTLTENAFSRSAEDSADEFALDLLARSGIRPAHLAAIFKKLDPSTDDEESAEILSWLGSHPDTSRRIQKSDEADRAFSGTQKPFNIEWKSLRESLP